MAKTMCIVLHCQNQKYSGTSQNYGYYSSASISVHSASIMVLGLLKKKKKKKKKKELSAFLLCSG